MHEEKKTGKTKKITLKEVIDYLENVEIKGEDKNKLLGSLNKALVAFPLKDVVVKTVDGGVLANGQRLNIDELVKFRADVSNLSQNWAFQLLGDQILYLSFLTGITKGDTPEQVMFSKTAIWFITKFRQLLTEFDVR